MSAPLAELTEKIWKSVTQETCDPTDIGRLISISHDQYDRIKELSVENDSLHSNNKELESKIESMSRRLSALEQFSHLIQYAEENS